MDTLFRLSDALGPLSEVDPTTLSAAERTFALIWELEAELNNGGLDQYYANAAGDHAMEAPAALRAIGAATAAAILERANATFGPGGPSADRERRGDQLDAMREGAFDALDEELLAYPDALATLLVAYVEANADQVRGAR